jgi:hypothetical protein
LSPVIARSDNPDPWFFQTDSDYRFLIPDKGSHFYGSQLLAEKFGPVLAFSAGLSYEIYQNSIGVGFSTRDLFADALGCLSSQLTSPKLYVTWDVETKVIWLRLAVSFR